MILNPSFDDAGLLPGAAAHWTLTTVTSLELIAGFRPSPEEAWEDFERWHVHLAALDDVPVVLAFFDEKAHGYEAFHTGWENAVYLVELPPGQLITCAFVGADAEDWETGWGNVLYWRDWAGVSSATGVFDGEPREDFDEGWQSNEAYAWTWAVLGTNTALFDDGQQGVESFGSSWPAATTQ